MVECTTTSAPSSSGCWRYGVAKVLSTARIAPTLCAASAAAPDVDDVQQRVRRRLDPDHRHVLVEVIGEVLVELVGRDVGEAVALRLVDLRGHAVDAAVDVGDQDDALARIDEVHQRRRRAEPRREREPVRGAFEARERGLERRAGRVRDARVVVALVDADRLLHVRRRLVDRRDRGARRGIGLLALVDGAGLELHAAMLAMSFRRASPVSLRTTTTGGKRWAS